MYNRGRHMPRPRWGMRCRPSHAKKPFLTAHQVFFNVVLARPHFVSPPPPLSLNPSLSHSLSLSVAVGVRISVASLIILPLFNLSDLHYKSINRWTKAANDQQLTDYRMPCRLSCFWISQECPYRHVIASKYMYYSCLFGLNLSLLTFSLYFSTFFPHKLKSTNLHNKTLFELTSS